MHCKFNPKKKKNLKDIQVGFIALNKKWGDTDILYSGGFMVHDATEIA
jgi:hypothetical protein